MREVLRNNLTQVCDEKLFFNILAVNIFLGVEYEKQNFIPRFILQKTKPFTFGKKLYSRMNLNLTFSDAIEEEKFGEYQIKN